MTTQQSAVLNFFARHPVATLDQVRSALSLSHMSVFRALKSHGFYTSFNHNGRYYTLSDRPQFSAQGLWFYRSIGFSRHGTLSNTLQVLVSDAPTGATAPELSALLHTPVGNLLACLARQQLLARRHLGHSVVYLSGEPQRQEQQWQLRLDTLKAKPLWSQLPVQLPPTTLLPLLTERIRTPCASVDQLTRCLQRQGISVVPTEVQEVFSCYQLEKKRGTLQVAEILEQVRLVTQEHVQQLAALPAGAVYTFDQSAEPGQEGQVLAPVIKTRQRIVVSLRFGTMRCREVLRRAKGTQELLPSGLSRFVPAQMRYAYDLIAHVGVEYYLHGNSLQSIQQELLQRTPQVAVPLSSLYDVGVYFLYLFGQLHWQRAEQLRSKLQPDGKSVCLLDCTQEAGSPTFFGVLETRYDILLGCWKMASENQVDVTACLRQLEQKFGKPGRLLHDLSNTMISSCAEVFPEVPEGVCHFHLARDLGEDLFEQPHKALSERLGALKMQLRLREQRKDQVDYLRQQLTRQEVELLLGRLLAGEPVSVCWTAMLGREILLAVHHWILDYAQDSKRQGYPFDPHLLYLHRRLVRAADALERLLAGVSPEKPVPVCLSNLCQRLTEYRDDAVIGDAAGWYEQAQEVFLQVRGALRLSPVGQTPLSESYHLSEDEQCQTRRAVQELIENWRKEKETSPKRLKAMYEIVLSHWDRYAGKLFYDGSESLKEQSDRTTNALERTWRENKRKCRVRHGRAKLSRDMQVLPAEVMLVGNLARAEYVQSVVGSLAELPQRLAEVAATTDESFETWKTKQRPSKVGQLPRFVLRNRDFLEHLLEVCLPLT